MTSFQSNKNYIWRYNQIAGPVFLTVARRKSEIPLRFVDVEANKKFLSF